MPSLRVVLDTNVIVSAAINEAGFEAAVLALGLAGKIAICASEPILAEYEGVLKRPKFKLQPDAVASLIEEIRSAAELVEPQHQVTESKDPDDNKFLECAQEAGAQYLVTGNKRHFPKRWLDTEIVNAREVFTIIIPDLRP